MSTTQTVVSTQPFHSAVRETDDESELESIEVAGHLFDGESSLTDYWNGGHLSALASAVSSFRAALYQAREGSEQKIKAQFKLVDALRLEQEEGTGAEGQHDECLSLAEDVVAKAAPFPSVYPEAMRALAEVLLRRNGVKTLEQRQRAVDVVRELVDLTSDLRADIVVRSLTLYAECLTTQYVHYTGNAKLLELANSILDRAMRLRTDHGLVLDPHLGSAFMAARQNRSRLDNSVDDIIQAIEMAKQIISNCSQGSPLLAKLWLRLGNLYLAREKLVGETGGYDSALHAYSEAMKASRPDHDLWFMASCNYAVALSRRFVSQSNLKDLNEAIAVLRLVVSRPASAVSSLTNHYLRVLNLSDSLFLSYAQIGNLDTLDEAISLQIDCLESSPPTVRRLVLGQLGAAYRTRYTTHGRFADLERSIESQEQALQQSDDPFPHLVDYSIGLAEAYLIRFDAHGQPADVEGAISVLRTAAAHPERMQQGSVHSLLGVAFLKKCNFTRDIQDIQQSIRCQGEALGLFPEAHSELAVSYHRLGLAEYRAFLLSPPASAIQNSVAAYTRALSIMSSDHPNRAALLSDLAASQLAAVETQGPEGLTRIIQTLGEAAIHSQSWPEDRYAAAVLWARTAHSAGQLSTALDAYRLAMSILPQVAWLGLEDELRVQRLSRQPPDISQDAAACAIQLGLYTLAVEIIDGSRTILWNTSQELRAELGRLREAAPGLAQELAETNAALAVRPSAASFSQDQRSDEAERHRIHRLAARRTELLHLARAVPGFQHFLVPPSYTDLRDVSRHGPVVILVSSTYRCDALLLNADGQVTLVPLPNVTHRLVLVQAEALQKCLRLTGDQRGREFLDRMLLKILRDLWEKIGKPVWVALNRQTSTSRLPRIWWCPTGPMTLLPIHACGPYDGVDPNMMDLAVSSYTPTLSALLRTRAKVDASTPSSPPRVLVIAQPEFQNRPPLPCVLEEARVLYSVIPSLCTFRIGPEGTVSRVKELLRQHNWLHISTHGSQNSLKPLDSSIALYDGDLKLSDLAQERMPNADFAFLSACHSARSTQTLPDESMHLAAGFMFAGFRSVVATSWAIADKDAPIVADVFYRHLTREGQTPEATETAEALHFAVKHLRDSGVPLFRWVPFIHLGA